MRGAFTPLPLCSCQTPATKLQEFVASSLSWNQQVFASVSAPRVILQGDGWASSVSAGPLTSVMKGKKLDVLQSCEVLSLLSPQAEC